MDNNRRSFIYAILAILAWATIPTAFKLGLSSVPVLTMLTIASVTSTLVLFVIVVAGGKWEQLTDTSSKEMLHSFILGMINPFIYYLILLKAYSILPAQVAQPLNMIWPIILVFLSVPFLGQKIPSKSYISLFISFAGVYFIASQGKLLKPGSSDPLGVAMAAGSSVFWALYFILNVRDKRDPGVKLFLNFFFASLLLSIVWFIWGERDLSSLTGGVLASVYVGVFEMGLTFWLWLKALSLAKSTDRISNLVYLAPFLSLIFITIFLGEKIYVTTPIGLILIIAGIVLQNSRAIFKT